MAQPLPNGKQPHCRGSAGGGGSRSVWGTGASRGTKNPAFSPRAGFIPNNRAARRKDLPGAGPAHCWPLVVGRTQVRGGGRNLDQA